ncbi:hypothetical protein E5Q_01740 [Mixia osmundae IAM 14324]|uniref:FHA domain-containing protein n=1 Tax=Mixia osmundae (strain CBS 9802 / IAM 14324 / JCM 22182 / KY 12970) TaxID=764103 RepID=G7DWY7_MIXOS|nr:hypothetical protein E5Q_01740 [Mixia osmundae IAM 14324]
MGDLAAEVVSSECARTPREISANRFASRPTSTNNASKRHETPSTTRPKSAGEQTAPPDSSTLALAMVARLSKTPDNSSRAIAKSGTKPSSKHKATGSTPQTPQQTAEDLDAPFGQLILLQADYQTERNRFPLTKETCSFGRLESCDVRLHLSNVSKVHAELLFTRKKDTSIEAALVVHSVNGLVLNGIHCQQNTEHALYDQDIIEIAKRVFKWQQPTSKPAKMCAPQATPATVARKFKPRPSVMDRVVLDTPSSRPMPAQKPNGVLAAPIPAKLCKDYDDEPTSLMPCPKALQNDVRVSAPRPRPSRTISSTPRRAEKTSMPADAPADIVTPGFSHEVSVKSKERTLRKRHSMPGQWASPSSCSSFSGSSEAMSPLSARPPASASQSPSLRVSDCSTSDSRVDLTDNLQLESEIELSSLNQSSQDVLLSVDESILTQPMPSSSVLPSSLARGSARKSIRRTSMADQLVQTLEQERQAVQDAQHYPHLEQLEKQHLSASTTPPSDRDLIHFDSTGSGQKAQPAFLVDARVTAKPRKSFFSFAPDSPTASLLANQRPLQPVRAKALVKPAPSPAFTAVPPLDPPCASSGGDSSIANSDEEVSALLIGPCPATRAPPAAPAPESSPGILPDATPRTPASTGLAQLTPAQSTPPKPPLPRPASLPRLSRRSSLRERVMLKSAIQAHLGDTRDLDALAAPAVIASAQNDQDAPQSPDAASANVPSTSAAEPEALEHNDHYELEVAPDAESSSVSPDQSRSLRSSITPPDTPEPVLSSSDRAARALRRTSGQWASPTYLNKAVSENIAWTEIDSQFEANLLPGSTSALVDGHSEELSDDSICLPRREASPSRTILRKTPSLEALKAEQRKPATPVGIIRSISSLLSARKTPRVGMNASAKRKVQFSDKLHVREFQKKLYEHAEKPPSPKKSRIDLTRWRAVEESSSDSVASASSEESSDEEHPSAKSQSMAGTPRSTAAPMSAVVSTPSSMRARRVATDCPPSAVKEIVDAQKAQAMMALTPLRASRKPVKAATASIAENVAGAQRAKAAADDLQRLLATPVPRLVSQPLVFLARITPKPEEASIALSELKSEIRKLATIERTSPIKSSLPTIDAASLVDGLHLSATPASATPNSMTTPDLRGLRHLFQQQGPSSAATPAALRDVSSLYKLPSNTSFTPDLRGVKQLLMPDTPAASSAASVSQAIKNPVELPAPVKTSLATPAASVTTTATRTNRLQPSVKMTRSRSREQGLSQVSAVGPAPEPPRSRLPSRVPRSVPVKVQVKEPISSKASSLPRTTRSATSIPTSSLPQPVLRASRQVSQPQQKESEAPKLTRGQPKEKALAARPRFR